MSEPDKHGDEESTAGRDAPANAFVTLQTFTARLAELTGSGKVERLVVDTFADVAKAEQASLALYKRSVKATRRLRPRGAIRWNWSVMSR